LIAAYHVLADGTAYRDLGPARFDQLDRASAERRLVHRPRASATGSPSNPPLDRDNAPSEQQAASPGSTASGPG